jgi:hypothetical protein
MRASAAARCSDRQRSLAIDHTYACAALVKRFSEAGLTTLAVGRSMESLRRQHDTAWYELSRHVATSACRPCPQCVRAPHRGSRANVHLFASSLEDEKAAAELKAAITATVRLQARARARAGPAADL